MKTLLKRLRGKKPRPGREFRHAGDAARNAHDWRAAEAAYARYLALNETDWPLWVQLGHAQKEQGYLKMAQLSYQRAVDLAPLEGDPLLQLGGLMERLGRFDASVILFRRAAAFGNPHAIRELEGRGLEVEHDANGRPVVPVWLTDQAIERILLDAQAARDLRQWDKALTLYRRYLEYRPGAGQVRLEFDRIEASKLDGLLPKKTAGGSPSL